MDRPEPDTAGSAGARESGAYASRWMTAALHDWNVPCGQCGYNLRNLKSSQCPECGHVVSWSDLPDAMDGASPLPRDWITNVGVAGALCGFCIGLLMLITLGALSLQGGALPPGLGRAFLACAACAVWLPVYLWCARAGRMKRWGAPARGALAAAAWSWLPGGLLFAILAP